MVKRTHSYKKKRPMRRKRTAKKSKGARSGKAMQNKSYSFVAKKYTLVQPLTATALSDNNQFTISHFGGKNSNGAATDTISIFNTDPDGMCTRDMASYQYFRITGMAFKLFFPEGTTPQATPVQWSMGYSNNLIIRPDIATDRLQSLASYQTSSCSAKAPISRYFRTFKAQKRLGLEWCNTSEYASFGAFPPVPLYNG